VCFDFLWVEQALLGELLILIPDELPEICVPPFAVAAPLPSSPQAIQDSLIVGQEGDGKSTYMSRERQNRLQLSSP